MSKQKNIKSRLIRFREVDEERIEFIMQKKGVGNVTDAVRIALAELASSLGHVPKEQKQDREP